MNITSLVNGVTVESAQQALLPLLVFVGGMVIYSLFVFKFYQYLGRREIFEFDVEKYNRSEHPVWSKIWHGILYFIKYLVVFPALVFFWFGFIAVLLAFLSKDENVVQLLLVAMAVVAAVRITAYYKEALSYDLAKMLPFALLGVLLVDISYFSIDRSVAVILEFPGQLLTAGYYLVFTIILEWVLRIGNLIIRGTEN